jgi:hypothetical protein
MYDYAGVHEMASMKHYIEKMYYFKCRPINTDDITKLKNIYVLGVLNNDEPETIGLFNELNAAYKDVIEECYYIISGARDLIDEKAYIMAYNKNKASFFTEFAPLLRYKDTANYKALKDAAKIKYRHFILHHLFPHYEEFDTKRYYNYLARKFNFLVFSYITEEERIIFINLIEQFRFYKVISSMNYHILLVKSQEISRGNNYRFFRHLIFSQNNGIFFTNPLLENILGYTKEEFYTLPSILTLLDSVRTGNTGLAGNPSNTGNTENTGNTGNVESTSQAQSTQRNTENKYSRSPIIVEKLENVQGLQSLQAAEIMNDKPEHADNDIDLTKGNRNFVLIVYFASYSFIFYAVYKKYFAVPDLIKES